MKKKNSYSNIIGQFMVGSKDILYWHRGLYWNGKLCIVVMVIY